MRIKKPGRSENSPPLPKPDIPPSEGASKLQSLFNDLSAAPTPLGLTGRCKMVAFGLYTLSQSIYRAASSMLFPGKREAGPSIRSGYRLSRLPTSNTNADWEYRANVAMEDLAQFLNPTEESNDEDPVSPFSKEEINLIRSYLENFRKMGFWDPRSILSLRLFGKIDYDYNKRSEVFRAVYHLHEELFRYQNNPFYTKDEIQNVLKNFIAKIPKSDSRSTEGNVPVSDEGKVHFGALPREIKGQLSFTFSQLDPDHTGFSISDSKTFDPYPSSKSDSDAKPRGTGPLTKALEILQDVHFSSRFGSDAEPLRILRESLAALESESFKNAVDHLQGPDRDREKAAYRSTCRALEKLFLDSSDPLRASDIEKIIQGYIGKLSGVLKKGVIKELQAEIHRQRGIFAEKSLSVTRSLSGGEKLTETMTVLDGGVGQKYLQAAGVDERYLSKGVPTGALRVSASKKDPKLQGVPINLERHEVTIDGKREILLHSGAPSTHGMKELDEKTRTKLATAQALAKVTESVKIVMNDPKKRKHALSLGNFLHVEQSLLSSFDSKEKRMIEEERGAFKNIAKNLEILFGNEESVTIDDDGTIRLTLKKEDDWEEDLKNCKHEHMKMCACLFVQGINQAQTLGRFFSSFRKPGLQEEINGDALQALRLYYEQWKGEALHFDENIEKDFLNHFAPGKKREMKDLEGLGLIQDLTRSLGGVVGINCKSGKDRTGMFYPWSFGRALGNDPGQLKRITEALREEGSLAHYNTGINTGKKRGYAFNLFQIACLPKELRPDPRLCSSSIHT